MVKKDLKQKAKGSDFLKIKESDKTNLFILAIFLTCFFIGYFVLIPKNGAYRNSKISIENNILRKANLEEKAVLLKGLGEKLKSEDAFIKKTRNVLPLDPQVPELLLVLDRLAIDNSLYLNAFSPTLEQPVATEGGAKTTVVAWKTVSLRFDIVGKYPDIKNFIKDLEQNRVLQTKL